MATPQRAARTGLHSRPRVVDLSTPSRSRVPAKCPNSDCKQGADSDSEDVEHSPRLPKDWLPLEYELLEYASQLPQDFADRVSCELEAQERRVAQLRGLNAVLLKDAEDKAPEKEREKEKPKEDRCDQLDRMAIKAKAAALSQSVLQHEANIRAVQKATHRTLMELAGKARAAEASHRQLALQVPGDDGKKRLFEAEARLQRLKTRSQQLENAKRHAERRAAQREAEEKQNETDIEYLQAEVLGFRARAQQFDALDQREEELRKELRTAKQELRGRTRAELEAPVAKAFDAKASSPKAAARPQRMGLAPTPLRSRTPQ